GTIGNISIEIGTLSDLQLPFNVLTYKIVDAFNIVYPDSCDVENSELYHSNCSNVYPCKITSCNIELLQVLIISGTIGSVSVISTSIPVRSTLSQPSTI